MLTSIDRRRLAGTGIAEPHAKPLLDLIDELIDVAKASNAALHPPVANLAGLKAIPAASLTDRMLVLCEELGTYRYDAESVDEADDSKVVKPTAAGDGAGRFIKMTTLMAAHADRHATGGADAIAPSDIGAAAEDHNHDAAYAAADHDHDDTYAAADHNHDGDYAAADHDHDGTYATVAATQAAQSDATAALAALNETESIATFLRNQVLYGGVTSDGTTVSSITTDPAPAHDFNADISAAEVIVAGVRGSVDAAVDLNVSSSAEAIPINNDEGIIYAIVVANDGAGNFSHAAVAGAAEAEPASPDDAAITTAVGHANWIRIADFKVARTADAITVTVTDRRPVMGAL